MGSCAGGRGSRGGGQEPRWPPADVAGALLEKKKKEDENDAGEPGSGPLALTQGLSPAYT